MKLKLSDYLESRLQTPAPTFYRRPGQEEPAHARLLLDIEQERWDIAMRHQNDGTPVREWHGQVQTFPLPHDVCAAELRALVEDPDVNRLAREVIQGFDSHWNGHSFIAAFSHDATEALLTLEDIIFEWYWANNMKVWRVEDWFENTDRWELLEVKTAEEARALTPDYIARRAQELTEEALADDVYLDGDVVKYLRARQYFAEDV